MPRLSSPVSALRPNKSSSLWEPSLCEFLQLPTSLGFGLPNVLQFGLCPSACIWGMCWQSRPHSFFRDDGVHTPHCHPQKMSQLLSFHKQLDRGLKTLSELTAQAGFVPEVSMQLHWVSCSARGCPLLAPLWLACGLLFGSSLCYPPPGGNQMSIKSHGSRSRFVSQTEASYSVLTHLSDAALECEAQIWNESWSVAHVGTVPLGGTGC